MGKEYIPKRDVISVLNGAEHPLDEPYGLNGNKPKEQRQPLTMLTVDQLAQLPPLRPLLGDILYEDTIAILYGTWGSWKTFLALDWALTVASGGCWFDDHWAEEPRDVIYVCAEGRHGMQKRVEAWRKQHDSTGKSQATSSSCQR